jgi:hypothetical protein
MPLLWFPRTSYVRSDGVREAYELGKWDAAEGVPDRLGSEGWGFAEMSAYERGRFGARLPPSAAPLSWPVEMCFIALEVFTHAMPRRFDGWRAGVGRFSLLATALPAAKLRATLEQRRARSLGLTADTAPQRDTVGVGSMLPLIAWTGYCRVRGAKSPDPEWPVKLAQTIIQAPVAPQRPVDRARTMRIEVRRPYCGFIPPRGLRAWYSTPSR